MPKKAINVSNFSGGVNNNTNPRDLADNEFQILNNVTNEVPGKLKMIGQQDLVSTDSGINSITALNYGNGLLHTNFDRNLGAPTAINETEYFFINDTTNSEVEILDVTNNDLETNKINYGNTSSRLEMYNVDGAVRVVPHYGNSGNTSKVFTYYKFERKLGIAATLVGIHNIQTGAYDTTDLFIAPLRSRQGYNYDINKLYSHIEHDGEPHFDPAEGSEVYIPSTVILSNITNNNRYNVTFDTLEQDLDDWEDYEVDAYTVSKKGSMAFIPYFKNHSNQDATSQILVNTNKRYGFWCSKVYKDFNGISQESAATYIGVAPQHASADDITQILHFGLIGRLGNKESNYAGFKIYWAKIDDFIAADGTNTTIDEGSVGAKYLFCEVDFEKGLRIAGEETYAPFSTDEKNTEAHFVYPSTFYTTGSDAYAVGKDLFILPTVEPYIIDAPSIIGEANTGFKTSTMLNRRVYAGNVQYYNEKRELVTKSDRVLKSLPNQFDYFEEQSFIDVEVEDGDSIVKLASTGNKLLQFKKQNLFIINVSRNIEFLEATFEYKGCQKDYHVVQGEGFVAWFNTYGAYIYDGNRVLDIHLNENGQPLFDDWETNYYHDNNVIGFIPKTKQLYITNTVTGTNILMFDIKSQSWITSDTSLKKNISNMITRNDGTLQWVGMLGVGGGSDSMRLYKWDNSAFGHSITGTLMKSKEYDFGTPMVQKNLNTLYINYKNGANVTVKGFGNKKGNAPLGLTTIGGLTGTSGTFQTLKLPVPDDFKNLVSFGIALDASGAISSDFEVNDIQLVYRDKVVR
tara:strand:- start:19120 stop:21516 length:2397 start_codon:yes stop_codon:yes gene_type:complete